LDFWQAQFFFLKIYSRNILAEFPFLNFSIVSDKYLYQFREPGWLNKLVWVVRSNDLSPIRHEVAPGFVNYKKGALDSQPQVIKLTSCLPMVGGSLWLPPPLKLVAMI
jgi:hypothetical protein